jgi:hypothetical protein
MPAIEKPESDPIERARQIIEFGLTDDDLGPRKVEPEPTALADLGLPWPGGLAPQPQPLEVEPDTSDPLPRADVLVVTWTVAEVEALADTLTPGFSRNNWYRYDRSFDTHYRPQIRKGAPALRVNRLGSYFPTRIGDKIVLCVKSELHLNQDGIATGTGTATLPVADFFRQMIDEVRPTLVILVITVGTAGATFGDHELGDVIITRAACFRLSGSSGTSRSTASATSATRRSPRAGSRRPSLCWPCTRTGLLSPTSVPQPRCTRLTSR